MGDRKGIMLAYPFEEKRLSKWNPPYLIQPKLDGERCRAVWYGLDYALLSSQENVFESVPHILNELNNLGLREVELDGELYIHGLPFEQIQSIVSRGHENIHPDFQNISFNVFDVVLPFTQEKRYHILTSLFETFNFKYIIPVKGYLCNTLDEILGYYDRFIKEGYEGFILRELNAPYKRSRSTFMMKFKPKQSDLYNIVGYAEEMSIDGILKNSLGALICEKDGTKFNIGTGFTRDERIELWKNRESLIGKLAWVKYQHITSANQVPRFPVFVKIYDLNEELKKMRGK